MAHSRPPDLVRCHRRAGRRAAERFVHLGAGGAGGTTHITVGTLPVVDNVGLYIAADRGIFRQVGLSVTIKQVLQSTLAIPQMEKGEISIIGGVNNVSFIQAAAKDPANPPFRLVMEAATCPPGTFDVLTLPSSASPGPPAQIVRQHRPPGAVTADHKRPPLGVNADKDPRA